MFVWGCGCGRGRGRGREGERERERERQSGSEKDRQTEREKDKDRDTEIERDRAWNYLKKQVPPAAGEGRAGFRAVTVECEGSCMHGALKREDQFRYDKMSLG